ncbi:MULTISPECIES: alpha/beta hydrolase [Flavobacterium]|uniref:Phospholipase n=1 Tax=Flavobacterium columnare TaxID=996 RepID=A0AA94JNE4_9FLAO|nr:MULTISPECIES: phospholipase [Flavobacterium]AMA49788.1 phospholipase [Flavobacterium covae]MCH4828993.1 phospholipase [Flavobacterium columnare]MCH4833766.1 phospholipase [Flavobacterium columnare]MCJ1809796.1 phospholipase [Flavobacterium covae]OWP86835.1 phospholipase [Flavobacterium covae]
MNLSLYHLVKEPKIKKDKNPLLLLLHGYGSNEEDLFSFASELPEHYYVISARAPYNLMPNAYAWYAINFDADENKFSDLDQARNSRELIISFIDELIKNYPIDPNKITLIGFSQGCILSYATALSYPNKIQRIVGMSGYFNQEIALENYNQNDFSNLQIFASHGSVDQVVPIEWARKAQPILNNLGIQNIYKEYPVGHGVAPQNFYDFKNWLLETE